MPRYPTRPYSKRFARQLRRTMTDEEWRLWRLLRRGESKWRRQEPLGPYIVDFLCYEFRVIVEVDGSQHGSSYDEERDAWLGRQGFRVLHFANYQVRHEIDDVMYAITASLHWRDTGDPPTSGSPG